MSFFPGKDPEAGDAYSCEAIAHVVVPRTVDLGDGFSVRRALPSVRSRMVGPFIFFDHFGPAEFKAGTGLDVRPHPHIGLATVTYLFDGEIMHRDIARHRGADPARRSQLDDRRPRHRAFRTHRPRAAQRRQSHSRLADVGGAAAGQRGNRSRLRPSRSRPHFR